MKQSLIPQRSSTSQQFSDKDLFMNQRFVCIPLSQETFSNVGVALITSTVMMIGEIGYRETLIDTSGSTLLPFPVLSFIVFTIFVITMAILLANLLVSILA